MVIFIKNGYKNNKNRHNLYNYVEQQREHNVYSLWQGIAETYKYLYIYNQKPESSPRTLV